METVDAQSPRRKSGRGGARVNAGRPLAFAGHIDDADVAARAFAIVGAEAFAIMNAAASRGSLAAARGVVSALLRAEQSLLRERAKSDSYSVFLKHAPRATADGSLFDEQPNAGGVP